MVELTVCNAVILMCGRRLAPFVCRSSRGLAHNICLRTSTLPLINRIVSYK